MESMKYELHVMYTENSYSDAERITEVFQRPLPKPDSDGCSYIKDAEFVLPDGTPMTINCEVSDYSWGLGVYEYPDDDSKFRTLIRVQSEGKISFTLSLNGNTELFIRLDKC